MKSKKGNKNLRIGVATVIAIFALANSFAATYAWFAMNTNVNAEGMNIRVNNEGQLLSMLTIHRCNSSASTDTNLVFFSEPAVHRHCFMHGFLFPGTSRQSLQSDSEEAHPNTGSESTPCCMKGRSDPAFLQNVPLPQVRDTDRYAFSVPRNG